MQKWQFDSLSAVSLLAVVVAIVALPSSVASALAGAEIFFGITCVFKYRSFNNRKVSGQQLDLKGLIALCQKLVDPRDGLLNLVHPHEFLQTWFKGRGLHLLNSHSVTDFLTQAVVHPDRLSDLGPQIRNEHAFQQALRYLAEHVEEPEQYVIPQGTESYRAPHYGNASFGSNAGAFMSPISEPLQCSYRPLLFYVFMEAIAVITRVKLLKAGYKMHSTETAVFFCKEGSPSSNKPPIVFLHGIGVGLFPYLKFLARLAATGHPIIAVHYRHVSMRICKHIPSPLDIADEVASFLKGQGHTTAHVIAHSYGTLVASAFNKKHSSMISHLTLIDPVCIAMLLPNMLANTLYFGMKKVKFNFRNLMKGIVVKDMYCAAALCRTFQWYDVNLWSSEMPKDLTLVLSGQDDLVPVSAILRMLQQRLDEDGQGDIHPQVLLHHGIAHGGFVLDPSWQDQIVSNLVDRDTAHSAIVWAKRPQNAVIQSPVPNAVLTKMKHNAQSLLIPKNISQHKPLSSPKVPIQPQLKNRWFKTASVVAAVVFAIQKASHAVSQTSRLRMRLPRIPAQSRASLECRIRIGPRIK